MFNFSFSASTSNNFFSQIGKNFSASSFRTETALFTVYALLLIVVILIAVIIFMWFKNRKNAKYVPHDWVLHPSHITNTLRMARDEREKFELQFHSKGEKRRSTSCLLTTINKETVTIECSQLTNLKSSWVGRDVDCYFQVRKSSTGNTFFMFTTQIIGIRGCTDGTVVLTLKIPNKLEQRQKRASLRISPPQQYVMGLAVWSAPEGLSTKGTLDIRKWGRPVLTYLPEKSFQIILENLSAGGIKVRIPRSEMRNCNLDFKIGDKLFMLLDLWDPDTGQRVRYWLLCRIQNPFIDFVTHDAELGLQFRFTAQPDANSPAELRWNEEPIGTGLDSIGNWVMRRHLELYREKGI
ncbi:PilZ domain-containing protein [Halodesulfovibrio marinisediminis]|uniref:PilZ domain-containing protein n=1 Tax=Halodesulfovibrio marinisediminis DSM 17456 TaxID=1121457 RepID=A0A1N6I5T3_9BACT|nr:PilZ domain-containing protein [Halodesulfovibrio marinisediminis]SIO27363.1 hypothetical protein SAMN02745161_2435 [Halodesulfovibrio marinisediminis DSM 17456]